MSASPFELRLATRANGRRDGELVIVNTDHTRCRAVPRIAPTLQAALDDWPRAAAALADLQARGWGDAEAFDEARCLAPLPRAYQWADASVYRNHARLMYRWRNEPIPPRYEDEPLVYQGGSDVMLAPTAPIVARSADHGIDLEAEIDVVVALVNCPEAKTSPPGADAVVTVLAP